MSEQILRLPETQARTKLSRSTIYRLAKAGKFPAPVALGPRAVGWRLSQIEDWLERLAQGVGGDHVYRTPRAAPLGKGRGPDTAYPTQAYHQVAHQVADQDCHRAVLALMGVLSYSAASGIIRRLGLEGA